MTDTFGMFGRSIYQCELKQFSWLYTLIHCACQFKYQFILRRSNKRTYDWIERANTGTGLIYGEISSLHVQNTFNDVIIKICMDLLKTHLESKPPLSADWVCREKKGMDLFWNAERKTNSANLFVLQNHKRFINSNEGGEQRTYTHTYTHTHLPFAHIGWRRY